MANTVEERRAARDAETRQQYAAADRVKSTSFNAFTEMVAARLEQGRRAYGDRSFGRDPAELAGEVEEEILDIVGWSFILWCRIRRLRERLDAAFNVSAETRDSRQTAAEP